jgi:hypothetical protein
MFKLADVLPTLPTLPTFPILPKLPTFPGIDFSALDVNALRDRLSSIDPAKLTVHTAKLTEAARDAAYIAIGVGVTSIELAKARREQITAILTNGFEQARELLRTAA